MADVVVVVVVDVDVVVVEDCRGYVETLSPDPIVSFRRRYLGNVTVSLRWLEVMRCTIRSARLDYGL